MLPNVPVYLSLFFALTVGATFLLLMLAINKGKQGPYRFKATPVALGIFGWLLLQAGLAFAGFYKDTTSLPPRFLLAVFPPLAVIVMLFLTKRGRNGLDQLSLQRLTYLNTVRVPVELVLYGLFLYKAVPGLMTFEGRNFDILVGITAPFVAYFGIGKNKMGRKGLLAWNVILLLLLLNIVMCGILSSPLPFQQFAFDQPNIALIYFPFIWLPSFVVPVAMLTHFVSIKRLLSAKSHPTQEKDTKLAFGTEIG
jgi:hypothetical protein